MKVKQDNIGLYVTKRIKRKPQCFYAPDKTMSGVGMQVRVCRRGYKAPYRGIFNHFLKTPASITVFVELGNGTNESEKWTNEEILHA